MSFYGIIKTLCSSLPCDDDDNYDGGGDDDDDDDDNDININNNTCDKSSLPCDRSFVSAKNTKEKEKNVNIEIINFKKNLSCPVLKLEQ